MALAEVAGWLLHTQARLEPYPSHGKVIKRFLVLELSGDGRKPEEAWLTADIGGKMELFWGPKGSGFAVIATEGSKSDSFMALDLRRGWLLRTELGPQLERAGTQLENRSDPD